MQRPLLQSILSFIMLFCVLIYANRTFAGQQTTSCLKVLLDSKKMTIEDFSENEVIPQEFINAAFKELRKKGFYFSSDAEAVRHFTAEKHIKDEIRLMDLRTADFVLQIDPNDPQRVIEFRLYHNVRKHIPIYLMAARYFGTTRLNSYGGGLIGIRKKAGLKHLEYIKNMSPDEYYSARREELFTSPHAKTFRLKVAD